MTATHSEGSYGNAVGVTTPLEHRMAQVSEFVKTTTANLIRPGILFANNASLVSGRANMAYDVAAFSAVATRSATSGVWKFSNDAVLTVSTTAAPGSNSRYDVVYAWQREFALDGTNSDPVIGVVQGTAAASPTVPSLSGFPGAIELARILVPAGVTATNSGTTITQTAPFTATAGGEVVVRNSTERDGGSPYAAASWSEGQRVYRIDVDWIEMYDGTTWYPIAGKTPFFHIYRDKAPSVPNNTDNVNESTFTWQTTPTNRGSFFSYSSGAVTVPLAGRYRVEAGFSFSNNATGTRKIAVLKNGTVINSNAILFQEIAGSGSVFAFLKVGDELMLSASDVLRVAVWQNSGGALGTPAASVAVTASDFFTVSWVGP